MIHFIDETSIIFLS